MLPSNASPADIAHCRALLARGSKTFSLASLLLPREIRPAVTALYAFCRVSDDLVDDGSIDPDTAVAALHARLDEIYAGRPADDPVDRSLASVVASYRLPRAWLDALVEGYRWDAQGRDYRTLDDVLAYAARVAGSVGACMGLFMGVTRREVLSRACDLGVAMQLTNIARDIVEDAHRGRLYLPSEWLSRDDRDPRAIANRARELAPVVERLLNHADELYARADGGIALLPPRFRRAIRAARWMYAEIGAEIRRRGYDVSTRTTVPFLRKAWLVLRSFVSSRGEQNRAEVVPLATHAFLLDAYRPG